MVNPEVVIVIPARLASTRLPGKMILAETGKPLIQHTIEAARRSTLAQEVVVGTEDPEIAAVVDRHGGSAILTQTHSTGTDRVAEVASHFPAARIIVNVQGDEPEVQSSDIDLAIGSLQRRTDAMMSTLAAPIRDETRLHDPACVKVIFDDEGTALWFSRSPIPHPRDKSRDWFRHEPPAFFQHVGIYAYRADFLRRIPSLPPSIPEKIESLEQLRVLSAGYTIHVAAIPSAHKGIDTLEDYRAFVRRVANPKPSVLRS